jgi:hypothetical protein
VLTFPSVHLRVSECHLRFDPQRLHLALLVCRRYSRRRRIPRNAITTALHQTTIPPCCPVRSTGDHHGIRPSPSACPFRCGPIRPRHCTFLLALTAREKVASISPSNFPALLTRRHCTYPLEIIRYDPAAVCCLKIRSPLVTDFNFCWRA